MVVTKTVFKYSSKSNYLRVIDRRNDTILPTSYDNYNISGLFHMSGMPSSNWWSGIHVKVGEKVMLPGNLLGLLQQITLIIDYIIGMAKVLLGLLIGKV